MVHSKHLFYCYCLIVKSLKILFSLPKGNVHITFPLYRIMISINLTMNFKKYSLNLMILVIALISFNNALKAQTKKKNQELTRILFVLDGSQSMLTEWDSGTKMRVAQRLLTEMVDSLKDIDDVEMALRVYGHQSPVPPQDCGDTKLEVPFAKNNVSKIKNRLNSIRAKGTTPIAYSLEQSANDFPKKSKSRNIIILITDGIESCDGDPCAVSENLQKQGIVLKPFVIGIGLDERFTETFECVGRYYDANDEDRFKEVLNVVVSQALNTTTLQVDLLNEEGKPKESDVNMTFYDEFTMEMKYNFIHTINRFGNPDTLRLDPIPTYKIRVHTIPSIELDSVVLNPGEHNTISIDAPQGSILVKTQSLNYHKDLQFIVKSTKTSEVYNVQNVNQEEKYLTGKYDVEIFTIPRIILKEFEVKQSKLSSIQIPKPGLITFVGAAPGRGAIYKMEEGELVWIKNLNSEVSVQTMAIQPGEYRVIVRPKNAKESVFTTNKKFRVVSGQADKVVLY